MEFDASVAMLTHFGGEICLLWSRPTRFHSAAARSQGYYVKEMESIAEPLVMLFTGVEGKVRGTLETVGGTAGTFCGLGGEVVSAKLLSNWGHRNSKECQVCANQRQTRPSMYNREASATWLISNNEQLAQFFAGKS
ncbi:hypothetical protein PO909_001301 [Leuciscus waleckii]